MNECTQRARKQATEVRHRPRPTSAEHILRRIRNGELSGIQVCSCPTVSLFLPLPPSSSLFLPLPPSSSLFLPLPPSSSLSLFPACPLPSLLPLRPSRPSHSLLHMPYHRHTRQALQAYSRRPAAVVDKLLRHRQLLSEGERSANSLSSLSLSSVNEAQGEDAPPSDLI